MARISPIAGRGVALAEGASDCCEALLKGCEACIWGACIVTGSEAAIAATLESGSRNGLGFVITSGTGRIVR